MASICSSDRRISASRRRLKPPLLLRDYLLDDLSSCSSNGFKSFPRRQSSSSSSTVRLLLDAEIKRSRLHHKRRLSRTRTTCGTALGNAVQKASTAFLNAVKLLPFPSSVKPPSPTARNINGVFARSFSKRLLSRSFWRKPDDRQDSGETGRQMEPDREPEIRQWRSFAEFLQESLDQPSDKTSVSVAVAGDDDGVSGSSSRAESEYFGSSEVVQSSSSTWSGESEASNENDAAEEATETETERSSEGEGVVVGVGVGESVGSQDGDGCSVKGSRQCTDDNRMEGVNEEKEQFSPVSVLDNPFEDEDEDEDDDSSFTSPSHHQEGNEKQGRKNRRFGGLVRLEPLDLEKRIERYTSDQTHAEEDDAEDEEVVFEAETRANHLFAMVKSRIEEPDPLLLINAADNLLLDFFQEDTNDDGVVAAETLMKTAEEWVLGIRQEEMFLSWEVKEKRGVYLKDMERREKWGCFGGERDCVLEELGNGVFVALVDELMLDLSSFC